MLGTWQYYAMLLMFIASAQAGLLVIANAAPILNETARGVGFLAANAWLLASFGGFVNAAGRVGTGIYSDKVGRHRAYMINGLAAVACLLLTPTDHALRQCAVTLSRRGRRLLAIWRRALAHAGDDGRLLWRQRPGDQYGLVFLGWGIAFLIPQLAGYIRDLTGTLDYAFYLSGLLMLLAVVLSRIVRRPARRRPRLETSAR